MPGLKNGHFSSRQGWTETTERCPPNLFPAQPAQNTRQNKKPAPATKFGIRYALLTDNTNNSKGQKMKNTLLSGLLIGLAAISITAVAGATSLTGTAYITSSGQGFTFDLSGIDSAAGSGIFTIAARGDYSLGITSPDNSYYYPPEYLDWNIDGIATGNVWGPDNADPTPIKNKTDDVWWTKSTMIDATSLHSITADNILSVFIQNSPAVDAYFSTGLPINGYVSWKLDYEPVPEPATMFLFGTGLAGLVGTGLRRKKR